MVRSGCGGLGGDGDGSSITLFSIPYYTTIILLFSIKDSISVISVTICHPQFLTGNPRGEVARVGVFSNGVTEGDGTKRHGGVIGWSSIWNPPAPSPPLAIERR